MIKIIIIIIATIIIIIITIIMTMIKTVIITVTEGCDGPIGRRDLQLLRGTEARR